MATGPVYRITKETENYERLCRAFVDLSTDVYRDIFRYYMFVEPSELWNEVNGCPDLKNKLPKDEQNKLNYSVNNSTISNLDLSFLYKLIRSISDQNLRLDLDKTIQASNIWTKVQADRVLLSTLSAVQEDKVKRASRIGSYSECDCLLLSILLGSQCPGYQMPALVPTSNRWGANPPRPADVKLGDDIERIRILRNSRYGHVSDTCIPDPDFKTIWTELTEIMSRMDKELQTGGYYSTALAELEKTKIDGRWEKYETKIKELNTNVKLVQLELHKQMKDQEKASHQVAILSSEQKGLVEKHEDITQHVATLSCKQKDLMEKHEDITQHVATLSSEQKDLTEKHEDITQHVATLSSEQKDLMEKHEDITQQVATLKQKQKDTADLEEIIKTQIATHDTNVAELSKVQILLENIITAKQLWDQSKQFFEDIKEEHLIEKAENKLRQLERKEDHWDRSIECAVKLEKELQDSRSNDTEPFISDALENELQRIKPSKEFKYLQYLHDAEKSDHEHNIHQFIDKASKEIMLKKEEISLGKLKSWTNNQKSFYPTKATEHIYKEVKSKRNCLTSGLPGSGKTANLQHVALRLKNEGHRLCCVQTFKELLSKVDTFGEEEKQVYFVDDVFGVHGVSEDKTKEWTGADKDDLERCLNNTNISILCSSRKQVTDDPKLSNIKSRFTIINISEGELGLSSEEHVGIFERHAITKQRKNLLTENKEQLKTEIKEKVSEIKCQVGCFPLVCHLYTGEEEPKLTMEEYFNKPLNVIADHLEKVKVEDRLSHFCLLLCLIYDNKLPVNIITVGDESKQTKKQRKELLELCKLPVATSREDIREKMDTLLQTFVKLEGDAYQFVHDIIHDAVIKHVSGMSSSLHQFILRHCSSKFMRYRVHLSGVVCYGHDTESCINIRPDSFKYWGVRVLDIVRDGVRTSDQLYNDIDEERCSMRDDLVRWDNPWLDVFVYNPCVHSTEGQTAIVQALASKSLSEVHMIMCTKGYSWHGGPRDTGLHWAIGQGLAHIVTQTVSMLSPTQLRELDSIHGLLSLVIRGGCGTDVIQALIVGGVDVNKPDADGDTALYMSVTSGDDKTTDMLLQHGANINQCYKSGQSLLYHAQLRGFTSVSTLLELHGAKCMYKGNLYKDVFEIPENELTEEDRKLVQRLKDDINEACKHLQKQFSHLHPNIFPVECIRKDVENIDILLLSEIIENPSVETIVGYKVKFVNPKAVSEEALIVNKFIDQTDLQMTIDEMELARRVIQIHSSSLFEKHRNLNIINMCPVKSKCKGADIKREVCIVLYCFCKGMKPLDEKQFPVTLGYDGKDIPVDVREGYFELGPIYRTQSSKHFHVNLKMGCGFGIADKEGTVGPFLKLDRGFGFLTCAHVTCGVEPFPYEYKKTKEKGRSYFKCTSPPGSDWQQTEKVYIAMQPSPGTFLMEHQGEDRSVGEVFQAIFKPVCNPGNQDEISIDAAIVKLTNQNRPPDLGKFAVDSELNYKSADLKELPIFYGDVIRNVREIKSRNLIVKFGMTSHATQGKITSSGSVTKTVIAGLVGTDQSSFVSTFQNQIEVGSFTNAPVFFQTGDSGSGVFQVSEQPNSDVDRLYLIGLGIGLTSYHTAIVTPIDAILKAFQLEEDVFKCNT